MEYPRGWKSGGGVKRCGGAPKKNHPKRVKIPPEKVVICVGVSRLLIRKHSEICDISRSNPRLYCGLPRLFLCYGRGPARARKMRKPFRIATGIGPTFSGADTCQKDHNRCNIVA